MRTIKKLRLSCKALKSAGNACISKLVLADPRGTTTRPQLEASLQSLRDLTSLCLSIQTTDQLPMLDADGVLSVLTGLEVNVASLGSSGCRAIVSYLERASKLQSLCLSSNKAAFPIGLGLPLSVCSVLRHLSLVDVDVGAQEAKVLLTATHLTALNVGFRSRSPWAVPWDYWSPRSGEFWDELGTGLSQLTALVELGTVLYAKGPFTPSQLTGLRALRCVVWREVEAAVDALLAMTRICDLDFCHLDPVAPILYERLFQFHTGLTRLLLYTPMDTRFDLNLLPTGLQHLKIFLSRANGYYPNIKSLQRLDVWSELCCCNLMRCIGPLTGLTHLGVADRSCSRVSICRFCEVLGLAWPDLSCLLLMSELRSLRLESPLLCHERNWVHLQALTGLTRLELQHWSGTLFRSKKMDRWKPQFLELLQGIEEVVLDWVPADFRTELNGMRHSLGHDPVRILVLGPEAQ
eukprot:jgi/Botrbrau1/11332/Bobra.0038s0091.1